MMPLSPPQAASWRSGALAAFAAVVCFRRLVFGGENGANHAVGFGSGRACLRTPGVLCTACLGPQDQWGAQHPRELAAAGTPLSARCSWHITFSFAVLFSWMVPLPVSHLVAL